MLCNLACHSDRLLLRWEALTLTNAPALRIRWYNHALIMAGWHPMGKPKQASWCPVSCKDGRVQNICCERIWPSRKWKTCFLSRQSPSCVEQRQLFCLSIRSCLNSHYTNHFSSPNCNHASERSEEVATHSICPPVTAAKVTLALAVTLPVNS